MSIRAKSLIILASTLVVLTAVLHSMSKHVLLKGYAEHDRRHMERLLIMGRSLDAAALAALGQQTHLNLALQQWDAPDLPPDFLAARAGLSNDSSLVVEPAEDGAMDGYTLLRDSSGSPATILRIRTPEEEVHYGWAAVRQCFITLAAGGLLFSIIVFLMLDRMVISPLGRLSKTVDTVAANDDLSVRLPAEGTDELSDLARKINGMLQAMEDGEQLVTQQLEAQRLAAIGELAAGVAQEIDAPMQYVGDNTRFLEQKLPILLALLDKAQRLMDSRGHAPPDIDLMNQLYGVVATAEAAHLRREVPAALAESLDGINRVTRILRAMRDLADPGVSKKVELDINRSIESTIAVTRHEWKDIAETVTHFEPDLPLVPCLPSEFNQMILNLLVNAAHAVREAVGDQPEVKGSITISTRRDGEWAEIRVQDTGTGIPEHAQARVFDPLFTTKGPGKGTGQGLAIAYNVVTRRHNGSIMFETTPGAGTTFIVRLPIKGAPQSAAAEENLETAAV